MTTENQIQHAKTVALRMHEIESALRDDYTPVEWTYESGFRRGARATLERELGWLRFLFQEMNRSLRSATLAESASPE